MIRLDPARGSTWSTYGRLVAQLPPSDEAIEPTAANTSLAFVLGQLTA